jgi:hypothetical protein
MIDINAAPDKTATTLERYLEDCENEDPYIQNIYMAARHLVSAGLGHSEYQTQYASGTTLWKAAGAHHSIPRIPYEPKKPKIVINVWKGLVDSVIIDTPIKADILVVDRDSERTEFQELDIEINPNKVAASYAEAKEFWEEEENEGTHIFVALHRFFKRHIDKSKGREGRMPQPRILRNYQMRIFLDHRRTICECAQCKINCRFIPGYLLPEDLSEIAAFLDYSDLFEFAKENLLASPGALVIKGGVLCRIRTLVAARNDRGWCRFFDGSPCTIHPVAPFGCAFFDSHQDQCESNAISANGLEIIARLWDDRPRSLYCEIWNDLFQRGMRAPAPEECRKKMSEQK